MIFLLETKKKIAGMKKVKLKLGFVNGLYVQRQGKGGGLTVFWKMEVNLEIKSYLGRILRRTHELRTCLNIATS